MEGLRHHPLVEIIAAQYAWIDEHLQRHPLVKLETYLPGVNEG